MLKNEVQATQVEVIAPSAMNFRMLEGVGINNEESKAMIFGNVEVDILKTKVKNFKAFVNSALRFGSTKLTPALV